LSETYSERLNSLVTEFQITVIINEKPEIGLTGMGCGADGRATAAIGDAANIARLELTGVAAAGVAITDTSSPFC
jgi:ribosomal protein S5